MYLTQWKECFHNLYVYQSIMWYTTLNISHFICVLYFNKAEKRKKSKEFPGGLNIHCFEQYACEYLEIHEH